MPFLENSSHVKVENGTFVDVSIHNETHEQRRYRGIDKLLGACIPQALHDSSECKKPGCFEGTREEHIRNITNWGLGDWKAHQARVLWLEGPAGVGKSAIAQTCAQDMKRRLGATFFFSRPNGWNNPTKFIPTIAYQLAKKFPAYRDWVDAVVLHDPLVLGKSIEVQFNELLVQPLQQLKGVEGGVGEDTVIIIDGLDECDESDDTDAQSTIIKIIIASVRQRSTPFLWALFSRPERHIVAAFSSKQATDVCLKLNLPISRDADADIEAYLRDGFRLIRVKYNFPDVFIWPSEEEIHQLVEQSAGLFIYTASAIRYVENPGSSEPTERLSSILKLGNIKTSDNPFVNLDRFYILILEQVPEGTLPNTLLLLSAFTTPFLRSSSVQGICTILGFSLAAFCAAVSNLHSILDITFDNGVPDQLSFYHASFSDFLCNKARSTPKFTVDSDGFYNKISFMCADALCRISNMTYDDKGCRIDTLGWSGAGFRDISACQSAFLRLIHPRRIINQNYAHLPADALQRLSRVNWCSVAQTIPRFLAIGSGPPALIETIPRSWRPRIIRSQTRPSLLSFFREKGLKRKLEALNRKRYVLGNGSNRVFLVGQSTPEGHLYFHFRTYPDALEFEH